MAVLLGNLALLLDVTSPRAVVLDRKTRPVPADVILGLFKKDPHHHIATAPNSFESDRENRNQRVGVRGKANSNVNAVDFAGSSDNDNNGNGNGYEDEDAEAFDWEKEMRKRVKEIEDMRELETKAEELQSRMEDGEGEGKEETEEEKRMRVRKELEKVAKEQTEQRKMAQLMFELGQRAYGKGTWTDKNQDKDQIRIGSTTNQLPSTRDYLGDFLAWRPPIGLEKNQAFWVALTLWLGLVGFALFLQR